MIFKFVSSGRDIVKRLSLVSGYRAGGLRMPQIESFIKMQRIMYLKKYHEDYRSAYGNFTMSEVLFFFSVIMIKHLLQKIFLNFTPNVLKSGKYTNRNKSLHLHVLEQIIWNNKFLKIGGKSLHRHTTNKGIVRVKDILDTEGKLPKWNTLKDGHMSRAEFFILMSIYDALPLSWKLLLKDYKAGVPEFYPFLITRYTQMCYLMSLAGKELNFLGQNNLYKVHNNLSS